MWQGAEADELADPGGLGVSQGRGGGITALMTVAGSIFLIAVGAILYFATNLRVAHVDVDTVGLILMLAGLAGLVLGFVQQGMWSKRSRREITIDDRRDPPDPRY